MKITVETIVKNVTSKIVWDAWTCPADIKQWNAAQDDWHTTQSAVDLREGGKFSSRMEAKDGSVGFDFEGVYTRIVPYQTIEYRMSDDRAVEVEFVEKADGILIKETFDAESENSAELQRAGWQAILDSFRRHVESKSRPGSTLWAAVRESTIFQDDQARVNIACEEAREFDLNFALRLGEPGTYPSITCQIENTFKDTALTPVIVTAEAKVESGTQVTWHAKAVYMRPGAKDRPVARRQLLTHVRDHRE